MKPRAPRRYLSLLLLSGVLLVFLAACGSDDAGSASIEVPRNNEGVRDAGSDAAAVGDAVTSADIASSDASAWADASSADATPRPVDTRNTPEPLSSTLGAPCSTDSDCPEGRCASVGDQRGVCTVACDGEPQLCPAGWSCESVYASDGMFCACQSSPEQCDGVDNDCDGLIDEGAASKDICAEETLCLQNACGCPSEWVCGDACRDVTRDAKHCGGCGNRCEVACSQSGCVEVEAASAGANHLCALLDDGRLRCAGANASGQLGDGTTAPSELPVDVLWMQDVAEVVAADQFSCARLTSGEVYCWGDNAQGQVAERPLTARHRPTLWPQISQAIDIDLRNYTGCAVEASGGVRCWGPPGFEVPTRVEGVSAATAVAVGDFHRCALVEAGRVLCWGNNAQGQLGDGGTLQREAVEYIPMLEGGVELSAGEEHTCVRLERGRVVCFGSNSHGQLGLEGVRESARPTPVAEMSDTTSVSAGARHTCAIIEGGEVRCWGKNASGQLGDGTTTDSATPVAVAGLPLAERVDAGDDTTCAVTDEGQLYCWGGRFGVNPRRVSW